MLTGVMVACLPEKIGSQKRYRCLVGGIGGVVITEIYCAVIVHIKDMASSALFETFFLVKISLSASSQHCWQA
ncbi:inner membrane protein [Escherichia coli]|uniref:Inner membrane protein CbrB n=1 Tax=Escherichia coli TaxID=562 RepID=A0A376WCM0_ECOLX|nr:inner membrane protein [Escherichia coli]